jgi:uncharacterized protein YecE (DUF72 family)
MIAWRRVTIERVHLGGPVWSCPKWVGSLFPEGTRAPSFLAHYARVFNAVEGNSTFYAVPPASTFAKWRDATPEGFKFCLKVPRTITHDRMLVGADGPWAQFLHASAELGDRLGPTMIQLPPTFGPSRLDALLRCLDALPRDRGFAVEPRHPAFFGGTGAERALDAALREREIDRVIFDATVLHASNDPEVRAVQGRKPRLPVPEIATANHPVVRLVGVGTPGAFDAVLDAWADRVAAWIGAGLSPHVFVHTADDVDVPALCATFHAMLSRRTDVGTLGDYDESVARRGRGQISLFET